MDNEVLFQVTIPGRCYVKKNTARVKRWRDFASGKIKTRKINSVQYDQWEPLAKYHVLRAIRGAPKTIDSKVWVTFKFYFKNKHGEPDLTNIIEGPQDLLVDCGIIRDDKLIESLDGSRKYFYDSNPRVEITIREFRS